MRKCQICKKRSIIQKSGAHQYGGGWAMRATKKRVVLMVNLHKVKADYRGVRQTMRLCTKCLRRVKAQMTKSPVPKTIVSDKDKTLEKLTERPKLTGLSPQFRAD